ncbi:MAG: peptide MFS transporter [marine benthic group bacterium]|nr:peptide MFS transporter [Candidatus Benthicola marisminoris]
MSDSTGSAPQTATPVVPGDTAFFGHPRGLATLFFTEMWERFSYYGGRGILILFMTAAIATGGLGMTAATAAAIYGLYTASVYLFALPGGWVADRLLGQRSSVFWGGLLIAAGNFSIAAHGSLGMAAFYSGLVLIVLGTGLLKPNVSTIVGELYPEGGARRDAGFSIFYMGINIGAFVAPLICGYLGENIDWHLGFAAAGVGMVLGLIQYRLGWGHLGEAGKFREEARAGKPQAVKQLMLGVALVAVIALVLYWLGSRGTINVTLEGAAQATGVIILAIAVLFFASVLAFGGLDLVEKKRVFVIFLLFLGAAIFWAGFEQAASSLNLFAERLTDRNVFGWEAPASWLQSINPLFIITLAPVFGWLWVWLDQRKKEPSLPVKFALGLLLLGAGFLVIAWGATYTVEGQLVSPGWLISTYFLHTCGELCLSPVGLSSITKLSPPKFVGQMMGTWFMGAALGNLVAGLVAGQFETMPLPQLFFTVAISVGVMGVLFLLLSRPIRRLMGGVH